MPCDNSWYVLAVCLPFVLLMLGHSHKGTGTMAYPLPESIMRHSDCRAGAGRTAADGMVCSHWGRRTALLKYSAASCRLTSYFLSVPTPSRALRAGSCNLQFRRLLRHGSHRPESVTGLLLNNSIFQNSCFESIQNPEFSIQNKCKRLITNSLILTTEFCFQKLTFESNSYDNTSLTWLIHQLLIGSLVVIEPEK